MTLKLIALLSAVTIVSAARTGHAVTPGQKDWPAYCGADDAAHYSPLSQINRSNVKQLAVAWSFDTGETGGLQTNPLIVGGVLFGITPTQKIFALGAATGKLLWRFDSGIKGTQPDRGLAYWSNGRERRLRTPPCGHAFAGKVGRSAPGRRHAFSMAPSGNWAPS